MNDVHGRLELGAGGHGDQQHVPRRCAIHERQRPGDALQQLPLQENSLDNLSECFPFTHTHAFNHAAAHRWQARHLVTRLQATLAAVSKGSYELANKGDVRGRAATNRDAASAGALETGPMYTPAGRPAMLEAASSTTPSRSTTWMLPASSDSARSCTTARTLSADTSPVATCRFGGVTASTTCRMCTLWTKCVCVGHQLMLCARLIRLVQNNGCSTDSRVQEIEAAAVCHCRCAVRSCAQAQGGRAGGTWSWLWVMRARSVNRNSSVCRVGMRTECSASLLAWCSASSLQPICQQWSAPYGSVRVAKHTITQGCSGGSRCGLLCRARGARQRQRVGNKSVLNDGQCVPGRRYGL